MPIVKHNLLRVLQKENLSNWSMSLQVIMARCMLGNFACFSRLLIFQNQLFLKKSFRNTFSVLNSLDPDQARRFVGPDLDLNCLRMLSADDCIINYRLLKSFSRHSRHMLFAHFSAYTCIFSVTSKSHTLNIGQYLVHSERRTADTSTLNFIA